MKISRDVSIYTIFYLSAINRFTCQQVTNQCRVRCSRSTIVHKYKISLDTNLTPYRDTICCVILSRFIYYDRLMLNTTKNNSHNVKKIDINKELEAVFAFAIYYTLL